MSEIAPLIPAATVVLLRDAPQTSPDSAAQTASCDRSLQVLMLQRNAGRGAFAGYWVFPGGRVDPTDANDEACAVREAVEETGVVVDPNKLVRWSHWTPPVTEAKRFGTWFFLAEVGADVAVNIDEAEIVGHEWMTPAEALKRRDAGDFNLAPPTFVTLSCLVPFTSVAEALTHAATNEPAAYATTMIKQDAKLVVAWAPDAALAEGATLETPGPRHRIHMNSGTAWLYDRS
jgi:8-oxo-dGTP pyrophosphatase MutT (NUDIX family)